MLSFFFKKKKIAIWASKMALQVMENAADPDDLSSVPWIHIV